MSLKEEGTRNGLREAEGLCLIFIVVETTWPKATQGRGGSISAYRLSPGRNSRQGLEAEAMKEGSSLAGSQLRFSQSPGLPAEDGLLLNKMHNPCPQADLREVDPQLRLPLPTCVKLMTEISHCTGLTRKPDGGGPGRADWTFVIGFAPFYWHVVLCFVLRGRFTKMRLEELWLKNCDQHNFRISKADRQGEPA